MSIGTASRCATERRPAVRLDLLRPIEELRIECDKVHLKNFVDMRLKVVSSLEQLVI